MKNLGPSAVIPGPGKGSGLETEKPAWLLTTARNYLSARTDFGGRREGVLQPIQCVLDEIRDFEGNG